jgi:hypothetical protein
MDNLHTYIVRSEVLMIVNIRAMVFRDVALYSLAQWYQMAWKNFLSFMGVRTAGPSETVHLSIRLHSSTYQRTVILISRESCKP